MLGAWHSPNTLPTMIHGRAFSIKTCHPIEKDPRIRHPGPR
jgi:hypothetical protein